MEQIALGSCSLYHQLHKVFAVYCNTGQSALMPDDVSSLTHPMSLNANSYTFSVTCVQSLLSSAAAMDRAVDKYLQDNPDSDDTQLMLWPDEAVQLLLFTCTKDTSVRIRRAVMSLLTSVVSRQQSIQEADIISTLVLKCRDKDSKVQTQAYEMLLQLPINILRAHLSVEDWCAVLDTALLSKRADHVVCAAGNERAEIQKFGTDLLHKYLDSQELLPWVDTTAAGALHGVSAESAALRALEFASCRLKALQLPWHNSTVYDAYGAALSSFESQQLQENL